jgi:hypothetical protein
MNPCVAIWTKPRATIDYVASRRWGGGAQFLPFALVGINGVATEDFLLFLPIENFATAALFIVLVGSLIGVLVSLIWTRILHLSGKIWNGRASIRSVEKVFALAFVPEIIITIHWISMALANPNHDIQPNVYSPLYFICNIITWRIMLIGLARTQKFSYGTAIVSIFLPYFTLATIVALVKALL